MDHTTDTYGDDSSEQINRDPVGRSGGTCCRVVADTPVRFRVGTERDRRRIESLIDENAVLDTAVESVNEADVFYDIGANIGVFSCLVGQHIDRVVAFESRDPAARKLRVNAAHNGVPLSVCRYTVTNEAGGSAGGSPVENPHALGTGEFTLSNGTDVGATTSVEVVPGEDLVVSEGLPRPTVATVTVNESEFTRLKAFARTLSHCRLCYVEAQLDGLTRSKVEAYLHRIGFDTEVVTERDDRMFLKAANDG
jgi:FkbM family methyltransferase